MMKKSEILESIRNELKKIMSEREANVVAFSKNMDVELVENTVKISLSSKAIGIEADRTKVCNMQDDAAAFEGWAMIIYTYFAKKRGFVIQLGLRQEALEKLEGFKNIREHLGKRGHYYRFLYRALKFSKQYTWFCLEEQLDGTVKAFDDYLKSGEIFTNNYPNSVKKTSTSLTLNENKVEDLFSNVSWQESVEGKKLRDKFGMPIFRQLPVGLFAEEKRTENAIFTGQKSAIDLWCSNDNSITAFELKWNNKMIGIITEIFFYCNFLKDLFGVRELESNYHFVPHVIKSQRLADRGYYSICSRKFKEINGYMLYDAGNLHQTITDALLAEMNNAIFDTEETVIRYGLIEYTVADNILKIKEIKKVKV